MSFKGIILPVGTLFASLVLFSIFKNSERRTLKSLPNQLEPLVYEVQSGPKLDYTGSCLEHLEVSFSKRIRYLKLEYSLCEIHRYLGYGISFRFKCDDESADHFLDSDREYYLVKVTNVRAQSEFLAFEQFIDYASKPEPLGNNWYFFEKNIFFD